MTSSRSRRIQKEVADMHADNLSHIQVNLVGNGSDLTHLKGTFKGPPGTAYEDGTYVVDVRIPNDYPFRPPIMKFETKIWHPNVSSQTVGFLLLFTTLQRDLADIRDLGSNLPRYPLVSLVPRPYNQIRPPIPTIPPLDPRTERPARRRSSWYAHTKSKRV